MSNEKESFKLEWNRLGLALRPDGDPYCNYSNILLILEKSSLLKDLFWTKSPGKWVLTQGPKGTERDWTDHDDFVLTVRLQREFGMAKVSCGDVSKLVRYSAQTKRRPPSTEEL